MSEYEYAVQWRYKGEKRWFTLAYRHNGLESARSDSNWTSGHRDNVETRVVRRPKAEPWEAVE